MACLSLFALKSVIERIVSWWNRIHRHFKISLRNELNYITFSIYSPLYVDEVDLTIIAVLRLEILLFN